MKVQIKSMKIVCDGCGRTYETSEGFVCYTDDPDGRLIWDDADSSDWMELGDRHYCPDCWDRDDDDNFVTKDGCKYTDNGDEITDGHLTLNIPQEL